MNEPLSARKVRKPSDGSINCLRSSNLKALKGRTIVARGKRVLASGAATERRPGYTGLMSLPQFAEPRVSANLICGIQFGNGSQRLRLLIPTLRKKIEREPWRNVFSFQITTGLTVALTLVFTFCITLSRGEGLTWPTNQLLPTFSKPAAVLDCIDVSSSTRPEINLFASLEGIVNRTQPQIVCVSRRDGEGAFTWVKLHNLDYKVTNGYDCILKYRSYVTGLVVTDPSQPDTLNLATTIAGVNNELICDPSLLSTLTNATY